MLSLIGLSYNIGIVVSCLMPMLLVDLDPMASVEDVKSQIFQVLLFGAIFSIFLCLMIMIFWKTGYPFETIDPQKLMVSVKNLQLKNLYSFLEPLGSQEYKFKKSMRDVFSRGLMILMFLNFSLGLGLQLGVLTSLSDMFVSLGYNEVTFDLNPRRTQ